MAISSLVARFRAVQSSTTTTTIPASPAEEHLHGLRGLLAISSILWIFFQTFIPHLVSAQTGGPTYQRWLRLIFSPVLWNESLISSFFIALSGRTICIRFLKDPKPAAFAGSIIRRMLRGSLAAAVAIGIVSAIFTSIGTDYVRHFKHVLPNSSIAVPGTPNNAVTALNAMFDIVWVVRSYFYQAANDFWPSQTIWTFSVLYQQSWTVYFLMVILPYTRASWHFEALTLFAVGSFWMNSWGWFDATSLLLADYVVNPKLSMRLNEGISVKGDWKVSFKILAAVMIAIGIVMKYTWTVLPQHIDAELFLHPWLDLAEDTSRAGFAVADPYPRLDNFFVIFGIMLLVETTPRLKCWLSSQWLANLGRRSWSLFVAQSVVFWTAGIWLFLHLHTQLETSPVLSKLAVFTTCVSATLLFGEVYHRAIDTPIQWFAGRAYTWLTY